MLGILDSVVAALAVVAPPVFAISLIATILAQIVLRVRRRQARRLAEIAESQRSRHREGLRRLQGLLTRYESDLTFIGDPEDKSALDDLYARYRRDQSGTIRELDSIAPPVAPAEPEPELERAARGVLDYIANQQAAR